MATVTDRPTKANSGTPRSGPVKRTARVVIVVLVGLSTVVFIWSAVNTSSARVTATTSGSSFFSAGTVDILQPDTTVELLFDADGLYPGLEIEGCVDIEYRGSIPASLRLHGFPRGGDGLEQFVDLRLSSSDVEPCSIESGASTVDELWTGRLDALWITHPDYHRGIVLDPEMEAADRLTLRAVATLVDDDDAQGRTTDFVIVLEARP